MDLKKKLYLKKKHTHTHTTLWVCNDILDLVILKFHFNKAQIIT